MTGAEGRRYLSCSTPVVVTDAQHLLRDLLPATLQRITPLSERFNQIFEIDMEKISFCIGTAFAPEWSGRRDNGSPA